MDAAPAWISKADWLALQASARAPIRTQQEETLALRQENDQLRQQLTDLATELAAVHPEGHGHEPVAAKRVPLHPRRPAGGSP